MSRLLFLLALSAPFAAAVMGELSKELLNEGLVSLDENGLLTTTCMVSLKDGSTTVQSCPLAPGFGPQGVGCFTVWNSAGFIQQGCYSSQEISLRAQCQKKQCHAHRKQKGISFCCCHGPLCNADYTQA
ncbi:hypothetical protein PRIPAC_74288 [Pristionchus pacificus]|uniref:Activin_recp domain-containing protein n=1 Tax=Pristionchus pacificus TaxID=54126 RepID=A0A2A6D058_PRIPA|nr:hypothetical protein PRIPAC_74288 [Pristionchus pacificus]|eukprot:PDM83750.1 hypothetical protein PRIPAC_30237 [Pristionchus pacificus]